MTEVDLTKKGLHHASASKSDLLFRCTFWASPGTQLPEEPEAIELQPEIPRFGRAVHKCMELHLSNEPVPIPDIAKSYQVDEKRVQSYYARISSGVDEYLSSKGWSGLARTIEKKLAYDPFHDRARFLSSTAERDYGGRRSTEMPGTADLALASCDPLIVFDWKTGVSSYDAAVNPQIHTLALAYTRIDKRHIGKAPTDVAAIGIIIRIDEEFVELSEGPITYEQLDHHRIMLRSRIRQALLRPTIEPGMHCKWCPALEVCPCHQAPMTVVDAAETMIDPEHVAQVYMRSVAAERFLETYIKKVRQKVTRYVEMNGPIELDNGKFLAISEFNKENLSKSSICRAMGKLEGETLISELRDKGAVESSPVRQLREVKNPSSKK